MSPTKLFEDAIENELHTNPESQFYLATDSLDDEKTLIRKYGERILVNKNKNLSRNSEQGIVDALVDLVCLSRTKKYLEVTGVLFRKQLR